ncbi:MAG: catechol 2,3-dioxygenase-like lactoylglutathione lyase family enzyme [Paracoccaceae bacterium]|jgi:catechol 2,3-dioxygenase-like lactoylglutathione lyase family enzyme
MDQRISLITLGVRDMDVSAGFYAALGWQKVEADEGVIAFDLIGQTLGLYPLQALADVFWGGHHGYFADPDGHIREVAFNPFSPLRDDGAFRWTSYGAE